MVEFGYMIVLVYSCLIAFMELSTILWLFKLLTQVMRRELPSISADARVY